MKNDYCLGDLAVELNGLSSALTILKMIVRPNPHAVTGHSTPTQETIDSAFFAIEHALDRIAEDLNDRDGRKEG